MSASGRDNVYGGFDYHFVGEGVNEFMCSICHKVLREPHLTECCGQHFCVSCLEHWSWRNVTCPQCRKHSYHHIVDKNTERKVNSLHVLCIHSKDGCQWSSRGELRNLKEHLHSESGCGYVEVACSNKCGVPQRRKDVQQHVGKECPLRTYQCEHCGTRGKYKDITTQHYAKCSKYPLRCPKGCPAVVKHADLEPHKNECPLEEVACPYSEAGCDVTMLRKDIYGHLVQGFNQHLIAHPFLQLRDKFGALSARMEETSERVSETSARVKRTNTRVDETNVRVKKTNAKVEETNARLNSRVHATYTKVEDLQQCIGRISSKLELFGRGMVRMQQELANTNARVEEIDSRVDETNARVEEIDARVDETNARVEEIDARVDETNARVDETKARVEEIDARVKETNARVEEIDARVEETKARVEELHIKECQ